MFSALNLKVVVMAVIYTLHITFFDALMSSGNHYNNVAVLTGHTTQKNFPKNIPFEYAYRMLLKHEQAKHVSFNLLDAVHFDLNNLFTFSAPFLRSFYTYTPPFIDTYSAKLYRLYRVFLI